MSADAPTVAALRACGALMIGKSAMTELGTSPLGMNILQGELLQHAAQLCMWRWSCWHGTCARSPVILCCRLPVEGCQSGLHGMLVCASSPACTCTREQAHSAGMS